MGHYEVSPEHSSVIYPVHAPDIRPDLLAQIESDGYALKSEFHVTVVSSSYGVQIGSQKLKLLRAYFDELPEPALTYQPDFMYHISKPKIAEDVEYPRESLVVPVKSPDISTAVLGASAVAGVTIPIPFLHVTIATRPDTKVASRGIGINSREEWQSLHPDLYASAWAARSGD